MKNLKKSLALVLVLVLVLGMVPLAASASSAALMNIDDFIDEDDIQYREAADVLAAIGVYQGEGAVGSRSFRPSDTITRAEAAAIMARVTLGTDTAQALALASTPFSDVPESHWASGYIMFGVDRGYLATTGYGDGTFRPNDPVTAVQMAKMLLGAIGYGVNGEFEGNAWDLRVVDRGMNRDIRVLWYTGDLDFSRPATREEVAQYTFNALTETRMVSWNSTINDYSSWGNVIQMTDARPSLGRFTFGLMAEEDWDGYGIGGRYWRYISGRTLTGYWQTHQILSTTTNGTPINDTSSTSRSLTMRGRAGFVGEIGEVWDPTAGTWTGGILGGIPVITGAFVAGDYTNVPLYVNGIEIPAMPLAATSASLSRGDAFRLAATTGVTVILTDAPRPDFDGRVDSIVIIAPTAKEASGAPIVSTGGSVTIPGVTAGTLQYRGGPANYATGIYASGTYVVTPTDDPLHEAAIDIRADLIEYPEGIERGDMLLVHQKWVEGSKVIVVEKAETVEGQMTSARTAAPQNITFGGQTFSQSGLTPWVLFNDRPGAGQFTAPAYLTAQTQAFANNEVINVQDNFNADAILYLDHNGGVIRAKLIEGAAPLYGLVIEYGGTGGDLQRAREVRMIAADGTVDYYTVQRRPNQTNIHLDHAMETAAAPGVPTYADASQTSANGERASNSSFRPVLVRYYQINDSTISIFTGQNHWQGTGNQAVSTTGYTALSSDPSLDSTGAGLRIAAHTTVFYFNWEGSDDTWANRRTFHAVNNPAYVGSGVIGANETIGGTKANFIRTTVPAGSINLEALAFNATNSNRGNVRYIFLRNTGVIETDASNTAGLILKFESFTNGLLTTPLVQTRPDDSNPFLFGVGLYSYVPTGSAGALGGVIARGPMRNANNATPNGSALIEFADAHRIQAPAAVRADTDDIVVWPGGTTSSSLYNHIEVGPNTRYYQYEFSNNGSLTPMPDGFNLNITRTDTGDQYFLLGVQPNANPSLDPAAVAIYFEYVPMTPQVQQNLAIQAISNAAGAANTISIQQLNTASGTTNAVAELLDGYQAAIQAGTAGTLNSAANIGAMIDTVNLNFANALATVIHGVAWPQNGDDALELGLVEINTATTIGGINFTGATFPAYRVNFTSVTQTANANGDFDAVSPPNPSFVNVAAVAASGTATVIPAGDVTIAGGTPSGTAGETSTFSVSFTVTIGGQTSAAQTKTGIVFDQS